LHGARIVLEDLSRLTEERIIDFLEVDDAGRVGGLVDIADRAWCVLGVVQNVVGLRAELEGVTLAERNALVGCQVPVVDGAGRQRITLSIGKGTGLGLNVISIGVDGDVANRVCGALPVVSRLAEIGKV
jgi:hypothetical protein